MNPINLLEALVLGTVQGIAEFLPVSSTGHMILLQRIFGMSQERFGLTFDLFTNIGTTAALVWYFRTDLWRILTSLRIPTRQNPLKLNEKLPWWIAGVTVIVAVAGYFSESFVESDAVRSLPVIAFTLIGFGLVMLAADYVSNRQTATELSAKSAYAMGIAQILAFIPGVSRSGATISTGLLLGLNKNDAARYSFLLSVPITVAAIAKRLITGSERFAEMGLDVATASFYIIALLAATISAYYTIRFLLSYLQRYGLKLFVYYRLALGFMILLWLGLH